jgi:hypothetical protein
MTHKDLDPCPSPPNESGFCGSQRDIQKRTGKYCEAKNEGIHHEVAVDICKKKQELLK